MTKTLRIPFSKDDQIEVYTIRVTKEVWSHFTELLIEAGKIRNAEVSFEEIQ